MFNAVKVFTATTAGDRSALGTKLTEWLKSHPDVVLVDRVVRQSSDEQFHCLTIIIFYVEKPA